ncbi:flap endonuclease-1 [Candidatus Woesearchaeota archaeon]|nr:flap endonuclease-1 [Candidatus Woesearchaeota archaeon]
MGVNLRDLLIRKEISFKELNGKVLSVDSFNMLYQFLTTIRTADGTPLMDSHGNVTSHLIGLFSRTTSFLQKGLKPVFVFDGEKPKLKTKELNRRRELKEEARVKYKIAVKKKDIAAMKKYAGRFSYLSSEMVEQAKELVKLLGLPVIQAPSEGEAQAAQLVKNNDAWAVVSQDYDSLLYGADRLIQNLSIAGRRKKIGRLSYQSVKPLLVSLSENLNNLKIDNEKLIALSMLIGTDYNPKGVKGIGPKNALKLVKKHDDFDKLFEEIDWDKHVDVPWTEIFYLIKKMPVKNKYKIEFSPPDKEGLIKFLVKNHDFSLDRVNNALEPIIKLNKARAQKSLGDF